MKIRLKVSVKTRGGRIFIPGVYDLNEQEILADLLKDVEDENVLERLYIPKPVEEEESEVEEEDVEESEEESEEKPKKKKKKKRVI